MYDGEHSSNTDFEVDGNTFLPSPEEIETWMKQQENFDPANDFTPLFPFDTNKGKDAYYEDINGFYDDDGNKIDLNSIPIPSLCIICKKYKIDEWDENLLCQMNRHDQHDEPDFKCGAFEKP